MFQKRSLTGFLVASLGLAAGLAIVASPKLASADDCAKYKNAEVTKVCTEKGVKGVESAMKDAVSVAKAKDPTLNCKSCHEGDNNKDLKSNAQADFVAKMKEHFGKPKPKK